MITMSSGLRGRRLRRRSWRRTTRSALQLERGDRGGAGDAGGDCYADADGGIQVETDDYTVQARADEFGSFGTVICGDGEGAQRFRCLGPVA